MEPRINTTTTTPRHQAPPAPAQEHHCRVLHDCGRFFGELRQGAFYLYCAGCKGLVRFAALVMTPRNQECRVEPPRP